MTSLASNNLGEGNLKRHHIVAPEFGDCVMIRVAVGRDEAHRDIAAGRLFDLRDEKMPLA